ncbi:VOC family protein [Nesterenkonia salmonea]|uniref:VOC family protein n=1 Tax=Nesterenkonia salmonea TaxID=1804987 RepID=A0A5R9B915_9MICC|nr:VOC family protein [Nesterenkonia salmonea]
MIIETDDFDEALRFYRDVLGMPEQPAFATEGDDRVSILSAGIATIELATPTHIRNIDAIEQAPTTDGPTLRIALEVHDTENAVNAVAASGAEQLSPVVHTPFQTLNARVSGPGGWQVTFFQELESLEDRAGRAGFLTDDQRARLTWRSRSPCPLFGWHDEDEHDWSRWGLGVLACGDTGFPHEEASC